MCDKKKEKRLQLVINDYSQIRNTLIIKNKDELIALFFNELASNLKNIH